MMNADQRHPTLKGYQIWADALKPLFTELPGPPAKTDHAPPPTGDPSVMRPSENRWKTWNQNSSPVGFPA
jgi:hypothetical protein